MGRILHLSPLPPAPTGIASYSTAVLGQLRSRGFMKRHRVDAPWPLRGPVEDLVRRADLAVYHLGNNMDFHRDIYALSVRHPGLVVLHDLSLDDLGKALLAVGDPLAGPTRAEALAAAPRLRASELEVDEPLRIPWCAYAVRRARGVIVHSEFGRRYLEAVGCRTPVFVVAHPLVERPAALRRGRRAARRIRERFPGRILVGVLGDIGPAKGIDAVLDAVARLGGAHVAVVGRRIPMFDVRDAIAAGGHEGRVTVAEDVSDAEFLAWLHASDVIVNLRSPHRGEVSGTVIRALHAGIPTVVSATGTYLDWPDDAVVRVRGGPPDPEELRDVLRALVEDPERRRAIGERARAHVERLQRDDGTGRGYEEAIEATLRLVRDPARGALARWAGALTDCGAGPEAVRRGLGGGYTEALEELGASGTTA